MEFEYPIENVDEKVESDEEDNHEDTESETDVESEYLPSKYAQSRMIKIIVGSTSTKPYYVHQNLLVESSDYFKTCLNSKFTESESGEIQLDMDDAFFEAFGCYVDFVYKDTYELPKQVGNRNKIPYGEKEKEKFGARCTTQAFLHARIYILAERLLCNSSLKRMALRNLRKTLYVAYEYPERKWQKDYPEKKKESWEKWSEDEFLENFESFRTFCHKEKTTSGGRLVSSTLITSNDLTELVRLIFENTPPPPQMLRAPRRSLKSVRLGGIAGSISAREVLVGYCASLSLSKYSREFESLFRTQDDVLLHFLEHVRTGSPIESW